MFAVRGDAAARYHAVHVRMVLQVLPPGMQDRDEADLGAQVFRIGGDRAQGFGAGAKQHVVERFLVLVGDHRDGLGDSKDHMEILDLGKQLSLAVFEPMCAGKRLALGTMPIPARVEGDALMAAGIALLDMPAERSRAAQFDCTHHAPLCATEHTGMR